MPDIIIGERCSGKTTELIKRSHETGSYIVVANKVMATCIFQNALSMGLQIPFPITIREYLSSGSYRHNSVLIDEFDLVLHAIFDFNNVDAITLTKRDYENVIYLKSKK